MPVALSLFGREIMRFGRASDPVLAVKIPAASPMGSMLTGFRSSGSWGFPSEMNKAQRLKAYTGYVHTCANARAQRDGAAKYQLIDNRTGDVIPEDKLPIPYSFFRRPNPIMSEYYLGQLISLWLNLCGTAPVLKIRNAAGVPVMQWPLMPNRITALYDPADWVRYEYQDDSGKTIKIPGRDVTFYRRPHPTKLFDGLGLLEGAGLFADTDALLWGFQRELFARGPATQIILQYPESVSIDQDLKQAIAEKFEEIFSDTQHPSFPAILDQGVEAKAFPVTNKGLEVPTINEEIKERIRSAFGTSRAILGETSAETFANAEGGERSFARFTETYLRLIDEERERSVLPEWDERLTGDFENVTPEDKDFALAQETARLGTGVLTINEVREDEGWDKVSWGDKPRDDAPEINTEAWDDDQDAPAPEVSPTADVQAQALNGLQVESLTGIIDKVGNGAMSKPTAAALIQIAFPSVPRDQIDALLAGIVVKEPAPGIPTPPPPVKPEPKDDDGPRNLRTITETHVVNGRPVEVKYVACDIPRGDKPEPMLSKNYDCKHCGKTTTLMVPAGFFPVVGECRDCKNMLLSSDVSARSSEDIRRAKSKAFVEFQGKHEARVLKALRVILAAESDAIVAKVKQHAPRTLAKIAECRTVKHAKSILNNRSAIDDIADMEEFAEEYQALTPNLVTLYTEAGTKAAKGYGMTFEVNAKAIKKIGNHLMKSTDAILKTTAEQIRAALEEGFLAGEGVEDLSQRIRELYDGISRGRALTIARTETVAPANGGALEGYRQAGVEYVEWIATDDELTRDTHAALDGTTVTLGDDFAVGADKMPYPGGGEKPEENINCRCAVAGVTSEGDGE